jgi:hypothetical protein
MAVHAKEILAESHKQETGMARFDRKAGTAIANVLGDMKFFWFCVVLDILALPGLVLTVMYTTFNHSIPASLAFISIGVVVAAFLSQTVIQLLALPVLQYSGNLSQVAADARAEATFRNTKTSETRLETVLQEIKARGEENARMEAQNNEILKRLDAKV